MVLSVMSQLFIMILYNSENPHSQFKVILPSIVLSLQFCDVNFISLTVVTE